MQTRNAVSLSLSHQHHWRVKFGDNRKNLAKIPCRTSPTTGVRVIERLAWYSLEYLVVELAGGCHFRARAWLYFTLNT